jgi:hypothetical protein
MIAPRIPRLTPTLHHKIVHAVRAGGFPHIAAQAFGVTMTTLEAWLRRGETAHGRGPYRAFAREFREAVAQARLKAELHVFNEDPPRWLERGPARDRADCPGWSSAVKALINLGGERSALNDPGFQEWMGAMMNELKELPDAWKRLGRLVNGPGQAKVA